VDVWELGDYEVIGDWFAPASRSVLDGGGMPSDLTGTSVLDVACGTGAVAIEAARRGATVTGVDSSPRMLAAAARRATAAGVTVAWRERSFDDLAGLPRASVVTSSFGVMFAADPVAVAHQLDAVTEPDGTIAVTAWHPDGAFGVSPQPLIDLIGPRPVDPTVWADPERVGDFFGNTGRVVTHHRHDVVTIEFPDVVDAIAGMRRWSGPWMALFEQLAAIDAVQQGERALIDHFTDRCDPAPAGIALRADYTVTQLAR
jgi:SAM-dependent methyltransferase